MKKSKAHIATLEVLKKLLPNYIILEEYRYDRILLASYRRNKVKEEHQDSYLLKRGRRLFCDLFIKELNIAIEIMGDQHYQIVCWKIGMSEQELTQQIFSQRERDKLKEKISNVSGARFLEVPYKATLDAKFLGEFLKRELGK